MPWVEVGCVKDFPGAWAEYRVYEGGILQVFRRIRRPTPWPGATRPATCTADYEVYAFGDLEDRCFAIPTEP